MKLVREIPHFSNMVHSFQSDAKIKEINLYPCSSPKRDLRLSSAEKKEKKKRNERIYINLTRLVTVKL